MVGHDFQRASSLGLRVLLYKIRNHILIGECRQISTHLPGSGA
jgi:hypothetical protein